VLVYKNVFASKNGIYLVISIICKKMRMIDKLNFVGTMNAGRALAWFDCQLRDLLIPLMKINSSVELDRNQARGQN